MDLRHEGANRKYNDRDVPELIQKFLSYYESEKKSQKTIDNYKCDLILFVKYVKIVKKGLKQDIENVGLKGITDAFIKNIKREDVQQFKEYMYNKGLADATRARRINAVKSFYRYLVNEIEILSESPAENVKTPKVERRLPVYLTLDESKELLTTTKESDSRYKERDFAIITTFLTCGLRLSELVSLNVSQIKQIKGDKLTIIGKGNKERTIYITPACLKAINDYLLVRPDIEGEDALFISRNHRRVDNNTVERIVKKHLKAAGLNREHMTAHKMRHTASSLMYKYGNKDLKALADILGHSSVSTTQIYVHVDDEQSREVVNSNPLANFNI